MWRRVSSSSQGSVVKDCCSRRSHGTGTRGAGGMRMKSRRALAWELQAGGGVGCGGGGRVVPPGVRGDRGVWAALGQIAAPGRSTRCSDAASDGSAETDPSLPSWPRLNSVRPSRGNPKTGPSPESRTLPDAPRRFSLRARLAQQSPRSRACSVRNPRSRRPIVVGNPKRPSFTARSVSTSRPSLATSRKPA